MSEKARYASTAKRLNAKGTHPNTIEALAASRVATQFTPETAPKGRTNAGLSVNEWRNELATRTLADVRAVLVDETACVAKVMAAQELLKAAGNGDLNAIAQVCDYTHRRPTQHSENEHQVHVAPAVAMTQDQINHANDLARRANRN